MDKFTIYLLVLGACFSALTFVMLKYSKKSDDQN